MGLYSDIEGQGYYRAHSYFLAGYMGSPDLALSVNKGRAVRALSQGAQPIVAVAFEQTAARVIDPTLYRVAARGAYSLAFLADVIGKLLNSQQIDKILGVGAAVYAGI